MLIWLLSGVGAAAFIAVLIIRNAEADDKRRKVTKRAPTPNKWQ